jgi:hypothetical protein
MFGWVARIAGALKCLDTFQHRTDISNPTIDIELFKRSIKIAEFYMGQNAEIMREMTLQTSGERTFTEKEKHLCETLQNLKPEVDNDRLAIAYILKKYNETSDDETRLKNSQALTALIRSIGLNIPSKKYRANGFINYTCLEWDKKTEILMEKYSTNSTSSTSLQTQGFEDVEDSKQYSTNSTNLQDNLTNLQNSFKNVENVENEEAKSTGGELTTTGLVENVENVENVSQENQENEDVMTI